MCIFHIKPGIKIGRHNRMRSYDLRKRRFHTNFLLFICQCCSCSRGLFQRLPPSGKHPSPSIDSFKFSSSRASCSFMADKFEQSRGLQRPKSESFMWPLLSNNRLSGLISLRKKNTVWVRRSILNYNYNAVYNNSVPHMFLWQICCLENTNLWI